MKFRAKLWIVAVFSAAFTLGAIYEAKGAARGYIEGGRLVINGVKGNIGRYGFKETTIRYQDDKGRTVTETIVTPITEPTCSHGMKVLRYGVRGC